ncbi:MAG: hypothetical protein U0746_18990 [Gemmataceae bacterium]
MRLFPLLLIAAFGCAPPEEIRRYRVEKPEKPAVRLLAAVVPGGDKIWFVKLTGKPETVEGRKAEFEAFVGSMKFAAGTPPVTYTVPGDWREAPSKQSLRHATFQVGPENMELTIIPLGQEAAALKPNVDRWRGQIGLPPIPETELSTVTRVAKLGDKDVTYVDMTGHADLAPATVKGTVADAPGAVRPSPAPAPKPIAYDLPPGWTEQPVPPGSMRVAAFRVGTSADGKPVDVTVIPLSGQSGGLLANVNRWRGEVGLANLAEADGRRTPLPSISAAGRAWRSISRGPSQPATTASDPRPDPVRKDDDMVHQARGPYDVVSKQKSAFETFAKSLRFTDAGGKP